MVKGIAVYGTFVTYEPVRQRYWIKRKDGVKQRYWKKTSRKKKVEKTGRYEFYGPGKELYRSVVEAIHKVPRGHVEVSTEEFLKAPEEYSQEGYWVERDIVS